MFHFPGREMDARMRSRVTRVVGPGKHSKRISPDRQRSQRHAALNAGNYHGIR